MERMFSRADLRKLLVPLMVEQALAMTIGMADTVMVASLGGQLQRSGGFRGIAH